MDSLTDVFTLLDIRSARCTRFEAGGAWALRFPAKPALKFATILRGECWITLPGTAPHRLAAGDTFLLANAPPYILANDQEMTPGDGIALFDWDHADTAHHGGAETVLLAGSFVFELTHARLLLDVLPPFMLIPAAEKASAVLRGTLEILDREIRSTQMGASLVTHRLAEVLLVQALRAYVAMQGDNGAGWIGALADPQMGIALNLMHGEVAHRWTVEALASAVGMSRSAFALRFKNSVGVPPLEYLLRWRMQLARDALRRGEAVASIAARIGYASESAFGNAFKRVCGKAPKRYWPAAAGQTVVSPSQRHQVAASSSITA
ncbi:AraC family transcriptional regulator [Humitalea rosea]|uniref:AraC family transcriptional regulator n=1 Tax=Humitalea rosea TaxID=990373 RepID=A0A2W7HZA8_9PROT|nr:AraC family transcriptional regulator [Humitalea rosea]PZW39269.1 AraC family transcriptional regulator [Humitalea rosea]